MTDDKYYIAINHNGIRSEVELDHDDYLVWIRTPKSNGLCLYGLTLREIIELIQNDFEDPSKRKWFTLYESKDIDKLQD